MENFRLRVFREVAAQMSFRKAAEVLRLSQPAVSQQIHALEEETGARLFDRQGNQIVLTEAGGVLLGYARQAAALMEEATGELAALKHALGGELRLGASTTIAQYILPRMLGAFHREHPGVRLSLVSGNTEEIVELVVEEKVALGLIEGPAMRRGLRVEALMRDAMVLIVGAKHGLAGREKKGPGRASISLTELAKQPLLLRERGSGSRRIVERALKQAGVVLKELAVAIELDSTEAIVSGVEAGLGVGFVSSAAIGKELRLGTVRVVAVDGVEIERDFSFVHLAGEEPAGAAAAFRRFAQNFS
jgi:DNA-binding transcriptional LysR family regulator